jgi:hypothetical protein
MLAVLQNVLVSSTSAICTALLEVLIFPFQTKYHANHVTTSSARIACFHHPVMDAQTVQRVILKLARLQMCPIASHLMHACRAHEDIGKFKAFYDVFKVHLLNVGRQVGIGDDVLDFGLDTE